MTFEPEVLYSVVNPCEPDYHFPAGITCRLIVDVCLHKKGYKKEGKAFHPVKGHPA